MCLAGKRKEVLVSGFSPKGVVGLCEFRGKLATCDEVCQKCGKVLCDDCAKAYGNKRYCPECYREVKKLSKLL